MVEPQWLAKRRLKLMAYYYVNTKAQSNGDHEVHVTGCSWMPTNKIYLGNFSTCGPAISEAKKHYGQVNGCYYCSNPCHTQ